MKLTWTREEEFTWAYFRPAGVIDIAAGVANDGSITAWEVHNYNSGASALRPLYDIPHQRGAFHASQSPLRQGSYRGLAATANHFARECHIDDLAHAVKQDPLAFRMKNLKDARLKAVLRRRRSSSAGTRRRRPPPATGSASPAVRKKGATSRVVPRWPSTARPARSAWSGS